MTNNKNTESSRVQTLVPQQLINDSAALVDFLKEYYNFLNQTQEPTNVISTIIENKDLDRALDKYISLIEKEIGYGMSTKMVANKINVYKNIEEFYDAKGSIESFKLLFRILFNVNVEIELPKEQILIASDGRWTQENVVYSRLTSGDPFTLVNTKTNIVNPDGEKILVEIERVRLIESGVHEITISQGFRGNIDTNSTITTSSYSGQIINSLSSFNIISSGKNFKVGQFLEVINDKNSESTSLVKVTEVDSSGGLVNFEFVRFGIGYNSDFKSYLYPVDFTEDFESSPADYGFPSADKLGRVFDLLSTNEYLFIEKNPYSLGYFAQDYVDGITTAGNYDAVYNQGEYQFNEIDQEVVDENQEESENTSDARALVEFKLSPLAKYKGYYSNNKGFLSDNIYLQDNYYYQVFSYVLKSNQPFENYKNIVRQTVHPAGMALFGQYEITNIFDASTQIEILERFYSERLNDAVDTSDAVAKLIIKPVADTVTTSQFWYYDYTKPLEENVSLISYIEEKLVQKQLTHSVSVSDVLEDLLFIKAPSDTIITSEDVDVVLVRNLFDSIAALDGGTAETPQIYAYNYFAQDYGEGIEQLGAEKLVTKPVEETVTTNTTEVFFVLNTGAVELDVITESDVESFALTKSLSDTPITSDLINSFDTNKFLENSINTSDSGQLELNPYSVGYFLEEYTEGLTTF